MLEIFLANQIYLPIMQVDTVLAAFIESSLTLPNQAYTSNIKLGISTFGVPKVIKAYSKTSAHWLLPRGFMKELVTFCQNSHINFKLLDSRIKKTPANFTTLMELYPYQQKIIETTLTKDFGVIVAPPGSGKTVMGLNLIAKRNQPALILVHTKGLLEQWVERIETFLGIDKNEIGIIGGGKKTIGTKITLGMLQTMVKLVGDLPEDWSTHNFNTPPVKPIKLSKAENTKLEAGLTKKPKKSKSIKADETPILENLPLELQNSAQLVNHFGLVMVDECHHIPAKTFREVVTRLNPNYLYGLTATPKRKNNDEKLIFLYIGSILASIDNSDRGGNQIKPKLIIRETEIEANFDYEMANMELLNKILIYDTTRNNLIVKDILRHLKTIGGKILVLTERKEQVDLLNLYLQKFCNVLTLTGDYSNRKRNSIIKQVREGDFEVLIATGQLFGEGMDINNLDCLFLVFPFAFEGKLVQYIGRIQRSKTQQVIYDYRDSKVGYFEALFRKRNKYYWEAGLQTGLV